MKLNYLFTTLLILIFNLGLSQKGINDNRFELDLHKEFSDCGTISFGDSTVFLHCKNLKPTKSDFSWKSSVLDSNLTIIKEGDLLVPKSATLQKINFDETYIYYCFIDKTTLLNYRIHHKTLKIDLIQNEIGKGISRMEFVSIENQLFLFLKSTNGSQLFSFNFSTKEIKLSDLNFIHNEAKLMRMYADTLTKSLELTVERKHDLNSQIVIYSYDKNLNLLQLFEPTLFMTNVKYNIQTLFAKSNKNGEYYYSGTYSLENDDVTEGIFCFGIKDNKELFLEKYIHINEINAFNRYLNEDGEETKELRKAKKNLITAVHEVIITDDHIYLLAEFFGPTYATGIGATVLFGGVGSLLSYQFDGYLYKGADHIAIDNSHEIVWDAFLNLLPYPKPFSQRLLVDVKIDKDKIQLIYPFKEQIQHTSLDLEGNQLSQKNHQLTDEETEKKQLLWYGNVYLDFGRFDKYIVYNEQSITDKVTVKHSGYFIEKYIHRSK